MSEKEDDGVDLGGAALGAGASALNTATGEVSKGLSALVYERFNLVARAKGRHSLEEYELKYAARVAKKAQKRNPKGAPSLRAGTKLFEESLLAESDTVSEYMSGILASASDGNGDDTSVSWTALAARLSSLDLQIHYLLYASARTIAIRHALEYNDFILNHFAFTAADLAACVHPARTLDHASLLSAMVTLERENLVRDIGWGDDVSRVWRATQDPSRFQGTTFVFAPSVAGVELLNWGFGMGKASGVAILTPENNYAPVDEWPLPERLASLQLTNPPATT
ncbi:hypothetical protein [Rathayibacter agropyri]|uniref:hypothetical protein n=1 Tax=Rathayibacter agropyri TaxID=1634927 RepID=UPI0015658E33|nr:hypothetical protein [Rathayibacter agropyri]NRD08415.1 hypothetical protein [Rathayibacter agropyri]